jgi:uncharacterized protein (TIGR02300 family)
MPARDLGKKHLCFKCSTRFYDLRKPVAICPKCGSDQKDSPANRPAEGRKSRLSAAPKVAEPVEPAVAVAEGEEAAEELDDDAEVEEEEDL